MENWFAERRFWSTDRINNLVCNTRLLTPPMLMLPWIARGDVYDDGGGGGGVVKQVFFSFLDNKYYDLPMPRDLWCIGSSRGWLILADCNANLTLLNPLSSERVRLPRAKHIKQLAVTFNDIAQHRQSRPASGLGARWDMLSMHRAVLSSDPHFTTQFDLAIILGEEGSLAVYQSVNMSWTYFDTAPTLPWTDAVFHQRQLYAVRRDMIRNHTNGQSCMAMASDTEGCRYLVETDENLFLVIRDYEDVDVGGQEENRRRTTGFRVYMKDERAMSMTWVPTRSLNGYVFFVGKGTSFSLLATHTGRDRGDLIYFLNKDNDGSAGPSLSSDCGVFCLQEGLMRPPSGQARPSAPQRPTLPRPPAIWVAPTTIRGFRALNNWGMFLARVASCVSTTCS